VDKLLSLIGLGFDLLGAVILTASLVGLERIEQIRFKLGNRLAKDKMERFRAVEHERNQRVHHDLHQYRTWIWAFIFAWVSIPPFLCLLGIAALLHIVLRMPTLVSVGFGYLSSVGLSVFLFCDNLKLCFENRKKEKVITPFPARELMLFFFWPVLSILFLFVTLRLSLESLVYLGLIGWANVTTWLIRLRGERFIGALGLLILAIGFLLQGVGIISGN